MCCGVKNENTFLLNVYFDRLYRWPYPGDQAPVKIYIHQIANIQASQGCSQQDIHKNMVRGVVRRIESGSQG